MFVGIGPAVTFMLKNLELEGANVTPEHIRCYPCDPVRAGGFSPENGVMLCQDRFLSKKHMEDTIVHELIHMYDHTKFNVDWSNLRHHACSEVIFGLHLASKKVGVDVSLRVLNRSAQLVSAATASGREKFGGVSLDSQNSIRYVASAHFRAFFSRLLLDMCSSQSGIVCAGKPVMPRPSERRTCSERGLGELFCRHATV